MILRERLPDNYDPERPWIIEAPTNLMMMRLLLLDVATWVENNLTEEPLYRGRRIGFSNHQNALLFFLAFR